MVHGRLAPSPTGFLHIGNAWAFWMAWLAARSRSGLVTLRMEDIDPARSRTEYTEAILHDLRWLGLDWDAGPDCGGPAPPYLQSLCGSFYEDALARLRAAGLVYPCYCTRKELRAIAGAPHVDDAGAPYPGTCRDRSPEEHARFAAQGKAFSWRLRCPLDQLWHFDDAVQGPQTMTLGHCGGDFALCRSDGVFAYQLAVVVDDMRMGVTQVVRGMDILSSTPRQCYVYTVLGGNVPQYAHLPLVLDHSGERLAKRHAALSLHALRDAGVRPEAVLGLLAVTAGFVDSYRPLAAGELLEGFSLEGITNAPLRLPVDPLAWLLQQQSG